MRTAPTAKSSGGCKEKRQVHRSWWNNAARAGGGGQPFKKTSLSFGGIIYRLMQLKVNDRPALKLSHCLDIPCRGSFHTFDKHPCHIGGKSSP